MLNERESIDAKKSDAEKAAKATLAAVAVAVGVVSAIIGTNYMNIKIMCVLIGFVVAILYPILGAVAVSASEASLDWAFPDRKSWDVSERAGFGTVWPVTLLASCIVSLFYGLVDRLYKE